MGVRISQGKVNDFHHKWANAEADAKIIFQKLIDTSATYIHTTEYKAFKPAFADGESTLAELAKKYSGLPVIANGNLSDPDKAESLLANSEADLIAIGTSALVNSDWVNKVRDGHELTPFDHHFLQPIATLKDEEIGVVK